MTTSYTMGNFENENGELRELSIDKTLIILGSAAVGAYIGLKIGSAQGCLIGALAGTFLSSIAIGLVKKFKVVHHPNGKLEFECQFIFD